MGNEAPGPDDWMTNAAWDALESIAARSRADGDGTPPDIYFAALAICEELATLRRDLTTVRRGEGAASLMLRQMVAECDDPETGCVTDETLKAAQKLLDE